MHTPAVGPSNTVGAVSEESARKIFDELKNTEGFFWEYIEDGCFARTHKICNILHNKGIYCEKIRADNSEGTWLGSFGLAIPKKDTAGKFFYAGFHMAVVIRVITPCGIEERIVDPVLFDNPATQQQWAEKLVNCHSIQQDGTVNMNLQKKDYTRTDWDVFETILFWRLKDPNLIKTNKLLKQIRKDTYAKHLERRRRRRVCADLLLQHGAYIAQVFETSIGAPYPSKP
jgi:hypothetical protein